MFSLSRRKLIRPLLKLCFPKLWLKAPTDIDTNVTNYEHLEQILINLYDKLPSRDMSGDYSQLLAALKHNIPSNRLRNLSIRSLVIHGDKDKVIRVYYGRLLSSILQCPLVIFRNSGHMVMVEREKEFNAILRAHIDHVPLHTHLMDTEFIPTNYVDNLNEEPITILNSDSTCINQYSASHSSNPEEISRIQSMISVLVSTIKSRLRTPTTTEYRFENPTKRPQTEGSSSDAQLKSKFKLFRSFSATIPNPKLLPQSLFLKLTKTDRNQTPISV